MNTNDVVQASLRNQLRGRAKYEWAGWEEGATYLLDNNLSAEDALKYSDESIQVDKRFENLMTKSRALEALNRKDEALATRNSALALGTPEQIHAYGRQLQIKGKQDEAFDVYRYNIKKNPDHWLAHGEASRMASSQKDFDKAVKEMKLAQAAAPDQAKPQLEGLIKRLEAKEDINR